MLADAGPHPNPVKAADGKRLHRLAVDEPTAAVVRRIFAEFLAGFSRGAIAARLTADGIPCPSANDPQRNTHRVGAAWSRSAVDAILRNPRYTGRQVWSRQRKDEVLIDVTDVALGYMTKMRWNSPGQWIYSDNIAHPPIIDGQTFAQAQQLLASPKGTVLVRRPYPTDRPYGLRGAVYAAGACTAAGTTTRPTTGAVSRARNSGRTTPAASTARGRHRAAAPSVAHQPARPCSPARNRRGGHHRGADGVARRPSRLLRTAWAATDLPSGSAGAACAHGGEATVR